MFGFYLRDQDQESVKHKNSLSFEAILYDKDNAIYS